MEELDLSTQINFEIEDEFLGMIDQGVFVEQNQREAEENEDLTSISVMQSKIDEYIEGEHVEALKRTARDMGRLNKIR